MTYRYLRNPTALLAPVILAGCVSSMTIPAGYYPAPHRAVSESLPPGSVWQGAYPIDLAGVSAPGGDRAAFLQSYFAARFSKLPSQAWHHPGYGRVRHDKSGAPTDLTEGSAFDRQHATLAIFEPELPLASAGARQEYQERVQALGATPLSLRYAVDEEGIRSGEDYLGALLSETGDWDSGVVRFFRQPAKLVDKSGERVYGVFIYPLASNASVGQLMDAGAAKAEVTALYYDRGERLFYRRGADGKPLWLAGLAHPEQHLPRTWAGDQQKTFDGVASVGGNCGASVRSWLSLKYQVPDSGYYHLGFGAIRYDHNKQPAGLTRQIAFDEERAQNLVFEPAPPLATEILQDYRERITVLKAKHKPLLQALEDAELQVGEEYIASSRGSEPLSHTGIIRFYPVAERSKDQEGRTVYGEFIHNWNPKKQRGPMTISALYQDPDSGLLFWTSGHPGRKMWIYGVAEPAVPDDTLAAKLKVECKKKNC